MTTWGDQAQGSTGDEGDRSRVARVALTLVLLLTSGCVHNVTGPVRTPTTYEHKAAATAAAASSSVATVDLAMQAALKGQAFATYLSVVISNAEDELGAASSTFSSIEPPDDSSLAVRAELLDILDDAADAVAAARIAVRNGTDADIDALIDALNQSVDRLQDFEVRYR